MAVIITINSATALDASSGLRNSGAAVRNEDKEDQEVSLRALDSEVSEACGRAAGVDANELGVPTTYRSPKRIALQVPNRAENAQQKYAQQKYAHVPLQNFLDSHDHFNSTLNGERDGCPGFQ